MVVFSAFVPVICHVSAQEQNQSSVDSDYWWASFLSADSKCAKESIFSKVDAESIS